MSTEIASVTPDGTGPAPPWPTSSYTVKYRYTRRAGTTPAIDQINKYFQINKMPVVSSTYWPMVHGQSVEQVRQDEEGLQTMRMLGKNMAWMLRCIEADREAGGEHPRMEKKIATNFIRPNA